MKKNITPYQRYYSRSYRSEQTIKENKRGIEIIKPHLTDIPYRKQLRVLDIACGTGLLGSLFSDNVYGFDLNPEAVKIAKQQGVHTYVGNVEKPWHYQNEYFNIVIASHIIEHVRNPDHILSEAKRVLKPGGNLIVITPNLASWFNRIILLFGLQPFFTEVSTQDKTLGLSFMKKLVGNPSPVGHLRVFTLPALYDLLVLHGFSIKKASGVEFGAFPWPISPIDRYISTLTTLASSLIIIARKPKQNYKK